ncbi:hypothetical protein DSO57_1016793 [Entomophthora muscae]|uniref:Uncharacterized protein n=1 Tax=Entomophthora muscae TaxID=34485 RepID=A0ACC2SU61_9FUNG|nr:hypothetical protein DSO57_1016793 [Entomophthora muscae]
MESLQKMVDEMKKREKAIHVLVNNAGASWGSSLEDISPASYHRVMDLNVKSLLFLTIGLLPELKAGGSVDVPSRVINIGSIQGIVIGRQSLVYDASKAAVHHLTKALAGQLASDNVLVNAIALGFYETSMTKGLIQVVGRENAAYNIPLGRTGQPHEIAGLCLFLASRASTYIVGSTIVMDGGVIAGKSAL